MLIESDDLIEMLTAEANKKKADGSAYYGFRMRDAFGIVIGKVAHYAAGEDLDGRRRAGKKDI